MRNSATLDATKSSFETVIFNLYEMLGILDLRSIGYYKIKHGVLQQNLGKYFSYKSADVLCEQFNKFVNIFKKEKEETNNQYPSLDKGDKRRSMSEKKILEMPIDLEKSCLSE